MIFPMTAKQRQIWYWQNEVEDRFKAWKAASESGNKTEAEKRKADYIRAKKTLEELEGDGE